MAFYWTTRAKPAGWAFGEILTSAQQNIVDDNAAQCPDEFPGDVTILGGVFVTDPSNFSGDIAVTGNVGIAGSLSSASVSTDACTTGTLTAFGACDLQDGLTVAGGGNIDTITTTALNCSGTAAIGSDATIAGFMDCLDSASVAGELDVGGDLAVGGNVSSGTLNVANAASFGAYAAITGGIRTGSTLGPNADVVIDPNLFSDVYVAAGSLSGAHTYTLPAVGAGASSNSECIFTSDNTDYVVDVVVASGGGTLANLQGPTGFGRPRRIRAKVISGAWRVLDREYLP